MRIGLCQLDIIWEDKKLNQKKVANFIREATDNQVDLILFPEMSLTGFSMNIAKTAEANWETVDYFRSLARQTGLNIGFGWVEACDGKGKNHYTIVSAQEEILSDYVKIHPFSYGEETKYFIAGNEIKQFALGEFNIATFICYDLRFPEIFQAVSNRAELVIIAANWPEPRKEHWRTLLIARAIENQTYIAGVNCVGFKGDLNYSGNSMLIAPDGTILKELVNNEGLLVMDMQTDQVKKIREIFPLKNDRQNSFYKSIL